MAITSEPSVLKDSFGGVHSRPEWFVGPPPKGLGPASFKKDVKTSSGGDGGLSVKEEWKGKIAIPACWVVKTQSLEMLPPFPLEHTHREIFGVEAEEVSSRISEALRVLSIEAEYNEEKAKAKCRTSDYACFRIRLYAGSEEGQPVVVELQRRSGPGISFMQSCRAILSAAEGQLPTTQGTPKKVPPFTKCPIGSMKCLQGVMPDVNREAELASALDKVVELLRKDHLDASALAMESLLHLTDPIDTCPESAMRASKTVVLSDEEYNLREEMTTLLERDGVALDFDHVNAVGQDSADRLRHLALLVFSNALKLTAKDGSLEVAVQGEKWFSEFLVPTLMDEVRSASTSPNNAYVACGCLNSLMSCSAVARGLVREYDGVQIIGEAHAYGKRRHELLATETERCMETL